MNLILKRDDYRCQSCATRCDCKGRALSVHHRIYKMKAEPWEYENNSLMTLCHACHERVHAENIFFFSNHILPVEQKIIDDNVRGTQFREKYGIQSNSLQEAQKIIDEAKIRQGIMKGEQNDSK